MNKKQKKTLYRILIALALVVVLKLLPEFPTPVELALYCIPYLVVGWDVLRKALKGAPQRLWRLIYHNWPWKLLALFLALCLWAGLITQDPTLTRERVFTDVTVSVVGADTLRRNSGLIVLSGLEDENLTARLRVDVPQREYNTVTASNYNPRVDLTRITEAGEQTLRINTTSTSTYGTVRGISPETITVVVDQFVMTSSMTVPSVRESL